MSEKATILYSRQELAERLRLAWKQREKNKSNIDIFLAHNAFEDDRYNSKVTSNTEDEEEKEEGGDEEEGEKKNTQNLTKNSQHFRSWSKFINTELKMHNRKKSFETQPEVVPSPTTEKKSFISINCATWETLSSEDMEPEPEAPSEPKPDYTLAKLKRASFQAHSNRAFNEPVVEKPMMVQQHKPTPEPKLRRTNSAPSQRRPLSQLSDFKKDIPEEQKPHFSRAASYSSNRYAKSAPIKRKIKLTRRHRSLDKDDRRDKSKGKARKTKMCPDVKTTDVVTMVSLVSSTDEESDADDISGKDNKLINELRNKLPTTPIIKNALTASTSIRKPIKSGKEIFRGKLTPMYFFKTDF